MANQVAARLSGDDYQHLYSWLHLLELKMVSRKVSSVRVEDENAGSVDDITVEHAASSVLADSFIQIKYHVDRRNEYSTEFLISNKPNQTSLLTKLWTSWQRLRARRPGRLIEISLISNWVWDPRDKVKACIQGNNNSISTDFMAATPRSELGKLRKQWQDHLGASDADLAEFLGTIRLKLGWDCADELKQRVADRMESLNLKSDTSALATASGIVRNLIKSGAHEIDAARLEELISEYDLYRPVEEPRGIVVYLTTIEKQKFEVEPDFHIDWRPYFEGQTGLKGHQLIDPSDWNGELLPKLQELKSKLNEDYDIRFLRVRGLARLSAWFAFGHTFSSVARYTLECDQLGQLWRTDAEPSRNFNMVVSSAGGLPSGEGIRDVTGQTVAVGISITSSLEDAVRSHISSGPREASALLFLRPDREFGATCLQSDQDAVKLAVQVKEKVRAFVSARGANRLLLYYLGPATGACFIGHNLNAVCQEIQIMEFIQPGYAPSFTLR